MINYSFIIPHHNSPKLLSRCLASIPQRSDIEIIVIDDNSDEDKRPVVDRTDVKLVCIDAKHTKGAGRARNIGLEHAVGKWVLFADADDYYADGFIDKIDETIGEDIEVLYYNVFSEVEECSNRVLRCNKIFSDYTFGNAKVEDVKYLIWGPWNKVISRSFIIHNSLHYEEIPFGNDAFFSFYVANTVKNYKIIQDKLYCLTDNGNSITYKKRSLDEEMCALAQNIRIHNFLEGNTACKLNMPLFFGQNIKNVIKQGGLFDYLRFIHNEYSLIKAFLQIVRYSCFQ